MTAAPAEILSRPLDLPCGFRLPNRLAKSAMSEALGTHGTGNPTHELVTLYRRLALGGAGLLVTGNVMVSPEGRGEAGNVVIGERSPKSAFSGWAAAAGGVPCFVQLNHAGRQVPRFLNPRPVAPSALAVKVGAPGLFAVPRALETGEIGAIVQAFGRSAAFVKEAGFQGVQIHGAHGYLVSQFLSPLTNFRKDAYGGSPRGRMRFLVEAYRAIRRAVGPGFPVALKLNSADFLRGGITAEESAEVARVMSEEGVDLLEISGGTYERPAMMHLKTSTAEREAHFLEFARMIRSTVRCPLMLTGGFRTPAAMARAVSEGSVDVVGLARSVAVEPGLPGEILAGRLEPSRAPARVSRFKSLTAFELAWYQQQLRWMSQGGEPRPDAGLMGPLLRSLGGELRRAILPDRT